MVGLRRCQGGLAWFVRWHPPLCWGGGVGASAVMILLGNENVA